MSRENRLGQNRGQNGTKAAPSKAMTQRSRRRQRSKRRNRKETIEKTRGQCSHVHRLSSCLCYSSFCFGFVRYSYLCRPFSVCCYGLAPCSISAFVPWRAILASSPILSTVLILSVLVLPCSLPSCAELCRSSWMCCRRSGLVWTRCCLFGSSCLVVFLFSLWLLLSGVCSLSTFKSFVWCGFFDVPFSP